METIQITDAIKEKYSIAQEPRGFEDFAAKHGGATRERLVELYFMRTRTCKIFMQRMEDAREVIDLVAEELQIAGDGHYLYGAVDGEAPLVNKIREYLSRGGDKVKLKQRVDELEKENAVLRSLIGK